MSAEDGCWGAADGCSLTADGCALAADVPEGSADLCVEADARRGLVHHGPLVASVNGELFANRRKFEYDVCHGERVPCELARVVCKDEADRCEEATFDGQDSAVGRKDAAVSCANAAFG
jgi:hypothetical protein